jgi:hypothetical protein
LEQFLYPLRVVPAFLGFFGVVVRLSVPRLGELKRLRRRKSASPRRNTDRRVARRSADIWLRSGVMVGKTADQLGHLGDDGRCQPRAVRLSSS